MFDFGTEDIKPAWKGQVVRAQMRFGLFLLIFSLLLLSLPMLFEGLRDDARTLMIWLLLLAVAMYFIRGFVFLLRILFGRF